MNSLNIKLLGLYLIINERMKIMSEIISIGTGIIFMFIGFGVIDEIMETERKKRKNEK